MNLDENSINENSINENSINENSINEEEYKEIDSIDDENLEVSEISEFLDSNLTEEELIEMELETENITKDVIVASKDAVKKQIALASSIFCAISGAGVAISLQEDKEEASVEDPILKNEIVVEPKSRTKTSTDNNEDDSEEDAEDEEQKEKTNEEVIKEFMEKEDYPTDVNLNPKDEKEESQEKNKETETDSGQVVVYENIATYDDNPELYASYNLEEELKFNVSASPEIDMGQDMSSPNVKNAMRYWPIFDYYGRTYGVSPYLLIAMSAQESRGDHYSHIPGGKYYNGAGYGIMQIEKPGKVSTEFTAYNHRTQKYETMYIQSEKDVYNISDNIKAGAMQLASKAKSQSYNPLVTLQGYNYGTSGIRYAIAYYLADGDVNKTNEIYGKNGTTEAIKSYIESNDTGWVNTPTSSGLTAREWYSSQGWRKFGAGGGDKLYIERVLKYYAGSSNPYIISPDGKKITF